MDWHWSPVMIPLGAFVVAIVSIVSAIVDGAYKQRLKAEERMAMVARGMNIDDIEKLLSGDPKPARGPLQSLANTRKKAIVLISSGVGLMLCCSILAWILDTHEVLSGAAGGLIPLSIGVGFLIDYGLQKRDLSRFGLEVGRPE